MNVLRIYSDPQGTARIERRQVPLATDAQGRATSTPFDARQFFFRETPPGHIHGRHRAPQRQLIFVTSGAGEIVLNSIDADGTKAGFDLIITRRISESVGVPVVASGGAGSLQHMADVLREGKADAVLAASLFHFGELTVGQVKEVLVTQGIPVRLTAAAAS